MEKPRIPLHYISQRRGKQPASHKPNKQRRGRIQFMQHTYQLHRWHRCPRRTHRQPHTATKRSHHQTNAKAFGGDAAQSAESYKLILSQLGPEIAQTPAALKSMGESVSVVSKLMGGDAVAATEVLTTAMNQFQVSTADPTSASKEMAGMMNIMAAAAKEGSAELPQIKSALEQSGMAAKTAGVSFAETNAAIQVLDKAGKKGAEGGVALRNVMATLSEGRFLPKDLRAELAAAGVDINTLGDKGLSLAGRLTPLQKIMGDSALITKLFGKENMNAAIAVVSGISEMERYTKLVQNTATATEQAATVMDSPAEKAARLQAKIDDLKISLFNASGGTLAFAGTIGASVRDVSALIPLFTLMGNGISIVTNAQKMQALWSGIVSVATTVWTGVTWGLSAALWANPITWVVVGIAALVAGIVIAWNKFEGFRKFFYSLWETMKQVFSNIVGLFKAVFGPIGEAIAAIKNGEWGAAAGAILKLNPLSMAARAGSYAADGGLTQGIGDAWRRG